MIEVSVNGSRAVSARLVVPWRGAWFCEVDLDPESTAVLPSGTVALIIGSPMVGTVDPRASGRFIAGAKLRIIGGAAGWDQPVPPQQFHNPAGVLSTQVYSTTAALVGETVIEAAPTVFAPDFVRSAGPAARVLRDVEWHVDFLGITQIAPRLPAIPDPSLEVLNYDPATQRLEVACDAIVVPGTPIVDTAVPPRWDGILTVRDVEQTFDKSGSRAILWCATSAVTRLMSALTNLVRETARVEYLRSYRCAVVSQVGSGKVSLQVINAPLGIPSLVLIDTWFGPGDSAKLLPGSQVLLEFIEGEQRPVVVACDPGSLPLERTVDATLAVHVGPSALSVDLAGGMTPLAMGPWAVALATALATFAAALAGAASGPLAPILAPATALATALGLLPAPTTLKVTGA